MFTSILLMGLMMIQPAAGGATTCSGECRSLSGTSLNLDREQAAFLTFRPGHGSEICIVKVEGPGEIGFDDSGVRSGLVSAALWSGTCVISGRESPCDRPQCYLTSRDGPDQRGFLEEFRSTALTSLELEVDINSLKEELIREEAAFEESGVVSVEVGSVCLDSASSAGEGPGTIEAPDTQVDKDTSGLRVKIVLPVDAGAGR